MASSIGTIDEYDPEKEQGFILPDEDSDGDRVPFEAEELKGFPAGNVPRVGDRVIYDVVGGMAGMMARDVRPAGASTATAPGHSE